MVIELEHIPEGKAVPLLITTAGSPEKQDEEDMLDQDQDTGDKLSISIYHTSSGDIPSAEPFHSRRLYVCCYVELKYIALSTQHVACYQLVV